MLKTAACFDAHFQAQSQRAHASVLYIEQERAANAAPCYHARPHMPCILSNDKSGEGINIHRAYMQTYLCCKRPEEVKKHIFPPLIRKKKREERPNMDKILSKLTVNSFFFFFFNWSI